MEEIFKLFFLLEEGLKLNSPVLSGSMRAHIEVVSVTEKEAVICIKAPFYDTAEYEATKKIIYTGNSYNGITDYAMWVNNLGAFGKGNKSQYWVNRVCKEVAEVIASEMGAQVINELPLA